MSQEADQKLSLSGQAAAERIGLLSQEADQELSLSCQAAAHRIGLPSQEADQVGPDPGSDWSQSTSSVLHSSKCNLLCSIHQASRKYIHF